MRERKAHLFPVGDPEGQPNSKRWIRIESDGSRTERIFLDVPDISHREKLICIHYLRHMARHFCDERIGVNIVGRDAPWDFRLELSTGREFIVEITSIADNAKHFEVNLAEERLAKWRGVAKIPFHELKKLSELFPLSEMPAIVQEHSRSGTSAGSLIDSPLKDQRSQLLLSTIPEPAESLAEQIRSAVSKKASKRHSGKEETVLIVDNRTSAFDIPDYAAAATSLETFLASLPFPEIWFYTGYYSSNDGAHAEFSFAPLKITEEQREVLERMSGHVDEHGRFIW